MILEPLKSSEGNKHYVMTQRDSAGQDLETPLDREVFSAETRRWEEPWEELILVTQQEFSACLLREWKRAVGKPWVEFPRCYHLQGHLPSSLICSLMFKIPPTRDNSLHSPKNHEAYIPTGQVPAWLIYTMVEMTVNTSLPKWGSISIDFGGRKGWERELRT